MCERPNVTPTMAAARMVMATATQLTTMAMRRLSFSGGVASPPNSSSSSSSWLRQSFLWWQIQKARPFYHIEHKKRIQLFGSVTVKMSTLSPRKIAAAASMSPVAAYVATASEHRRLVVGYGFPLPPLLRRLDPMLRLFLRDEESFRLWRIGAGGGTWWDPLG